jgi:predicted CoA-binding protein
MSKAEPVAILGASNNPERYAHKALSMLREHGYRAIPVHPALNEIDGVPVSHTLGGIAERVDTLTLYVNPGRLADLLEDVVALKPRRVIFNPGTESPSARARLESAGVHCVEACTLVLLRTGQFETA